MGDTSNLTLELPSAPAILLTHIRAMFDNYASGAYHYEDDVSEDEVTLGANDISVGTVDQLASDFDRLQTQAADIECPVCEGRGTKDEKDCVRCNTQGWVSVTADLAYRIHDDPAYEWLGSLQMHVPGLPDFASACDADGKPTPSVNELMSAVDEATDLDELKQRVRDLTGKELSTAFDTVKLIKTVTTDEDGMLHEHYWHQVQP